MHRLLRVFPLFTGLGLFVIIGTVSCGGSPLLAPTGTVINLTVQSDAAALNSIVNIIAVLIENGQQSGGTGTGTAATGSSTTGAGTPVHNGTVVSFTTSLGTIEPAEAKTENGKVTVQLKTTGESGTATITAYSGGAKSTATIKVGATNAKTVTVSANPQNLGANGGSSVVSARVDDTNGNGLAGVSVVFSTTKGALSSSAATTNSGGIATTTLTTTSAADVSATVAAVTGKVTVGVSTKATISVSGPSSSVSVSTPATFSINVGTTVPVTNVTINYGDGSSKALGSLSGTQSVTHTYAAVGIYDVTVSATDPDGVVTTAGTQVAITGINGTIAVSPSSVTRGTITTFTATVLPASAAIDRYVWTFGDGTTATSTGGVQQHVYAQTVPAGIITVTVQVYPVSGSVFTIPTQINIPASGGTLSLSAASSSIAISAPQVFTIDVGSTVATTNISINYGDGTSRTLGSFSGSKTDTKFYSTPGTYTATATGTDPDGVVKTSSTIITVTGLSGTLASSATTITRGTAITYIATVLPAAATISKYVWDFGDGTTAESTGNAQSKVYATTVAPGTLTVKATVFPVYGSSFTISMPIAVAASKGTITLTNGNVTSVATSTAVTFTIDVGTTVALSNVTLKYGDNTATRSYGSFTGTRTDTHFFQEASAPGAYSVTASGIDPDGNTVSSTLTIVVVNLSATATSTGTSTATPVSFTVTVTPTAALIDHYEWEWKDGTSDRSTGATQNHKYLTPGTFSVVITVVPAYAASFKITLVIVLPT